jgi:O-acetylserine/cysteine efflux transporter
VTPPSRAIAPLDFLQLLAIALIWGANNIAAKIAVDAFPPLMSAAMRFVLVLLVLAPWLRAPKQSDWKAFAAMLAFTGPVHFGVLYAGLRMADDAAPMVVAMQLWAPASVALAALLLGERVSGLRWAGVVVAFAGAVSLNFDPAVFAQAGALIVTGLGSCIYGLGAVFMRRVSPMSVWNMQAWVALATAPSLALCSLLFERNHLEAAESASWPAWAATAWGALLSSVLASTMLFRLVQRYEVSRTTPYLLVTPAVSFVLAWLLLGDRITPQIILGAAITMSGVTLVALAERRLRAAA